MKNFFMARVFGWVRGKLDGYKTLIGGIGLILVGIVGVLGNIFPDVGLPAPDPDVILTQFASGFAVLGIGGKLEKAKVATQTNVEGGLGNVPSSPTS